MSSETSSVSESSQASRSSSLQTSVSAVPALPDSMPKPNVKQNGSSGLSSKTKVQTKKGYQVSSAILPRQLVATSFYPHVFHLLSHQLKRVYYKRTQARQTRREEYRRRKSQNFNVKQAAQYDRLNVPKMPSHRCSAYVALNLIASMGKLSRLFVISHTQHIISLMECIAIDLPYAFTRPSDRSHEKSTSRIRRHHGRYTGDPKLESLLAKEPTEACKTFVLAMNLISMNLTNMKVKCLFQEGMVEVRQVFLRILGHLISHCKTIYALEAVVAVLRRWILGKKKQPTIIAIPELSSKLRVLPEMLSDTEKEVFLKKLHQFVMRFRETPAAIPLMTDYLDIVYQLSCRYGFVPKSISPASWLQKKISSSWSSPQKNTTVAQSVEKSPSRRMGNKRQRSSLKKLRSMAGEPVIRNRIDFDNASPTLRNLLQKPFTSALLSPNPKQRDQFYRQI